MTRTGRYMESKNEMETRKIDEITEVKEVRAEDAREIGEMARLFAASFSEEPWNESWTEADAGKRLKMMLDGSAAYGLAAYDGGRLCAMAVGCFELYCGRLIFNLREFCVDREKKGRGLGTAFFKELERRLREKDAVGVTLNTLRGRTEKFYISVGLENDEAFTVMTKKL